MMLAILFSLTSMETLENWLQTNSGGSSQSCHSVDTDTWCKLALSLNVTGVKSVQSLKVKLLSRLLLLGVNNPVFNCYRVCLGSAYTKHQCCNNSATMLVILFSLKSIENWLQTQSGVTPLISMRTESQASSQCCHSIDAGLG